jgi:CDP-diacylglycerol--glycerol-3-phosphate 3-phosphatidyltransferase
MKREFLTASNILSISRILLVIPFLLVMFSGAPSARLWALLILALAALTDRLDGLLARRYGQETEWGRVLDPLADKIGVAALGLVLLVFGLIPLWFVVVLLGRDLLILAGGIILRTRTGRVVPSNTTGKWAVGTVAVTLGCALLDAPPALLGVLFAASTVILALSLVLYARRFFGLLRPETEGNP